MLFPCLPVFESVNLEQAVLRRKVGVGYEGYILPLYEFLIQEIIVTIFSLTHFNNNKILQFISQTVFYFF